MIGKMKVIGLALMASFAFSGMATAEAMGHQFFSATGSTVLTGENEGPHEMSSEGATVTCESVGLKGTQSGGEVDQIRLHPEYAGCTFLESEATVTTNGCDYVFDSDTGGGGSAQVEVDCEGENAIEIETGGCTIAVESQLADGVTYTNVESLNEFPWIVIKIIVKITIKIIKKKGLFCGLIGNTAAYEGEALTSGYVNEGGSEGEQVDVWVE